MTTPPSPVRTSPRHRFDAPALAPVATANPLQATARASANVTVDAAASARSRVSGPRSAFFIIVMILGLFAAPAADAQDADRFLKWSYQDGKALAHDVAPSLPYLAAGSAAFLVGGSHLDAPVLHGIQSQNEGPVADFLSVSNEFGSTKMIPATAGVFAVSLLTDDAKFQDAAFTSMQSLIYSTAAVFAVKYAVGRMRPEAGNGTRAFDAFSGNTSFPSGHTAAAFAVVTPWVMYYPNPVTYGLFAVSAGTAVARIAKDRHWPTDVLTGAAIGYFTARYLSNRHQVAAKHYQEPAVQLTPLVSPDAVGLNVSVSLN